MAGLDADHFKVKLLCAQHAAITRLSKLRCLRADVKHVFNRLGSIRAPQCKCFHTLTQMIEEPAPMPVPVTGRRDLMAAARMASRVGLHEDRSKGTPRQGGLAAAWTRPSPAAAAPASASRLYGTLAQLDACPPACAAAGRARGVPALPRWSTAA